ncbi:MAG: hypothetical protein LLF92_06385 [Planctomycetaceae bacterium]|nr:hypothetical protein [Planctomycetaceae bacterium]
MYQTVKYLVLNFFLTISVGSVAADCSDFEIDGTYEASWDIPLIYFLFKHAPEEPPLLYEDEFLPNYGYLDTGASGILMSRLTVDLMRITTDANAVFVDTGVAGDEFFDVSESLYIGTADFDSEDIENPDIYRLTGPWRFQVSVEDSESPIDVLGIPIMAGKTAIITPVKDFEGDRFSTSADIKDSNDANIPATDFQVALRFEKYINPSNPENILPLPAMAYNPVIDNITVEYNGVSSTGSFLFDTGGQVSIISVLQGMSLGLVDADGEPVVPAAFYVEIAGIGGGATLPGFTLGRLSVPTLNGFNLVYLNARVCVHDIGILDEDSGEFIILDGVFGDNFTCSSMDTNSAELDMSSTPFDHIVIDTQRGLLGFDVNSTYSLPVCRYTDLKIDCIVDINDLSILSQNWLRADCNNINGFCQGTDIDKDGRVNSGDYAIFADDWQSRKCQYACGSESNPRPTADLTGDCRVDFDDLQIVAEEWLKTCDWLNFRCRGADLENDGIINFKDFNRIINQWYQ